MKVVLPPFGLAGNKKHEVTLMTEVAKQLIPEQSFSMLAIANVHANINEDTQLSDGTWVLSSVPLTLEEHWTKWIGTLRAEKLRDANLVLLTQHRLPNYLRKVFFMLQLDGVPEYDQAESILGYVNADGTTVNQMSQLAKFGNTRGYVRRPIDLPRIERAVARAVALCSIEMIVNANSFQRFIRGLSVWRDGLLSERGQDRNHQFVRSLEALILPETGETRKNFIHRCQTFAIANQQMPIILGESFDMRCDTEHLQDWQRALQNHEASDRENVAFHRTRQMEKLASFAYARIFDDETLWPHFSEDLALAAFWALRDDERKAVWGSQSDLTEIPFVSAYDARNRGLP
jgi:hypothetical protein